MAEPYTYISDKEAKELICEIGRRVYNKNFVAANDGNISIRTGDNEIWTTPTGVSKGFMEPDMMVKMDLSGNVLEGTNKPSSEVKMHLRVYQENPESTAVVHAHPPVATSFAIAGIALDKPVSPEAIVLLGKVPVAPYATPGTQEVPDSIAPYCKDYNAVLLANHGALTWGRNITEAYFRMESLEHYALMLLYSNHIIQKSNELTTGQIAELITIRKKMGIQTGGIPAPSSERKTDTTLGLSEDVIGIIVRKVTEEVLRNVSKWSN
ncbi:class II aldolase/adducin family protein [Cytobacillus oceanisediminis]|uniref:L-fuculose-phosphate aldolase n=1 Tax=Cytobacillus oceanisediminis TaxID=665099 RepID=A0A562JXG2_9BACI|nr:class II aldolase/adducin family protein [Cytobacillus oceanisediminis]TWH87665.1 L-fuculose-phosphate aldolase [Cytobacillus oceanisediminis]